MEMEWNKKEITSIIHIHLEIMHWIFDLYVYILINKWLKNANILFSGYQLILSQAHLWLSKIGGDISLE